jgi:hypothetical protein
MHLQVRQLEVVCWCRSAAMDVLHVPVHRAHTVWVPTVQLTVHFTVPPTVLHPTGPPWAASGQPVGRRWQTVDRRWAGTCGSGQPVDTSLTTVAHPFAALCLLRPSATWSRPMTEGWRRRWSPVSLPFIGCFRPLLALTPTNKRPRCPSCPDSSCSLPPSFP